MATEVLNEQNPSVVSLVSGILQDAQKLVTQQFELFKQELRGEVDKATAALKVTMAGASIAFVGAILLGIGFALALQAALPELPLWASFAIFGGVFLALGGGLCLAGWGQLHTVTPLPEQSENALKENMQWLTNQK
jgi:hypothetical protein